MKKIIILLMLIGFLSSCSNDDSVTEIQEFAPGDVTVGIKSGTDINDLFNFINKFDLKVDNINSIYFTSDLPSDSLQFVLDNLNKKNYTNDGGWLVTGYLHYQTNQIWIFPRLVDINNIDNQQDWLKSMVELKLHQKHETNLNSTILFKVPDGQELKWKKRFESYDIVDWAELNYIIKWNNLSSSSN